MFALTRSKARRAVNIFCEPTPHDAKKDLIPF
uniref:Uncharacterized protein n=1 Tax=Anguilla anguilla TaxID=7936 RepID=A0A0E9UPK2_ANGAN